MALLSAARKLTLAGQVVAQQATRSRLLRAGWQGVRATWTSFSRVLRLLWLQITGVFFLAFALGGAGAVIRMLRQHQAGQAELGGRLYLAAAFTLVFAYFGATSFWRANRDQKRSSS